MKKMNNYKKIFKEVFKVLEEKELFGTNIHIFSPEEQEDLSKYLNEEYEAYQKDQEAKGPLIKKL